MTEHSLFCQCRKCVTKKILQVQDDPKVTRICEPMLELCPMCKAPKSFDDELQAICVALLDIQVNASKEQKEDHRQAIEFAKSVVRLRISRANQNHWE